jgi:hypothetical protein
MNLLEGINGSLGTNQNPGDCELNFLKYFFSRVTSLVFLGRVFWVAFFESRFLSRVSWVAYFQYIRTLHSPF